PALVLALDPQGRIALWNRRLEETTGFGRDEMVGTPGEALIGEGGVRALATKSGGERLVRWERARVAAASEAESNRPLSVEDDPASKLAWTYAVGTDVTAEEEMRRRTLRAERLAAVGTMAAGLAHEVRNPLNSAALQLEVLRRRLAKGDARPETIDPVAALVQDEIRRLEHLVDDFLSFARPRPLELKPTSLADLCKDTLAFFEPEAVAHQVTVSLDLPAKLPPIQVDPERMRQVLQNLIRNALEAMGTSGRLTVRLRRVASAVELDVEDTGPGFGEDTPVFDAFFTTKIQGTGLGLSIVHRIVSDHGGSVRVRSRPGCTCFTLSLPA
ncbi:MAG TPA: ATP-binding protein, partial [Polyangia bacterium]|nr:ATP-binding protein [Polyangia bacterium]